VTLDSSAHRRQELADGGAAGIATLALGCFVADGKDANPESFGQGRLPPEFHS